MIRVVTPGRIIAFRTSGSVAWTYDLHSGYFNEAAALGIDGSAYVPVTVGGFNGVPRTTGVLAVSHAGNGRWFAPIPAMATPVIGGDGTVDVAGTSNGLEHGTPTVGPLRQSAG